MQEVKVVIKYPLEAVNGFHGNKFKAHITPKEIREALTKYLDAWSSESSSLIEVQEWKG